MHLTQIMAAGVAQHHDGVSGTAKQHVSDDYSKRVQAGINRAADYVTEKLRNILAKDTEGLHALENLSYCQLINETICEVSQVSKAVGSSFDAVFILFTIL